MALKLSTGLKNFLLNGGSLKEAFEDALLDIYSGTPPTSADDAVTGQLLCRFTRASGVYTPGTLSTAQVDQVVVTAGSPADTFTITIDGTDFVYAQAGGDTADLSAVGLAALVNASAACAMLAVAVTGTTESAVL